MTFLSSFPPCWLMPFVQRIAPGIVYAPLTAPGWWHDTMHSPDDLRQVAALLMALLVIVAGCRWRPPGGGGVKFSTATAFSYRNAHTRISRPRNPQNHTR